LFLVSVSGVSLKGEDALVVAAVVEAGVGDVGEPGTAESASDQVADGSVGIGLVPVRTRWRSSPNVLSRM